MPDPCKSPFSITRKSDCRRVTSYAGLSESVDPGVRGPRRIGEKFYTGVMLKITSADNPRFKAARRLQSSRGRKSQERIIVYGAREILRAVRAGVECVEVFGDAISLASAEGQAVLEHLPAGADVLQLSSELMVKLAYGDRADSLVLVARRPGTDIKQIGVGNATFSNSPLVVILERPEKPGNVGAVLRSADGAGASALLIADPQCDPFHPNAIRSSMGSVFTVPLAITSSEQAALWCESQRISVVALDDRARSTYSELDWTGPTALVLGNESQGLSANWRTDKIQSAAIPMLGISDSLNVSVAASVVLYEALRQRSALAASLQRGLAGDP